MIARSWPLRQLLFLSLLLALFAAGWAPAPQEGDVVVVGQVANGTPEGLVPPGLPVSLHVFSEMEERGSYNTTLTDDASFRFDEVIAEEGDILIVRAVYQNVPYFSAAATLEAGQQEMSLPLTIYETTDDSTDVVITQLHIFATRAGDRSQLLQIAEYYLISNNGDRTYIGTRQSEDAPRTVLSFTLPEEADNLTFEGAGLGARFLEQPDGFADTEPIPPGTSSAEVSFAYELPYQEELEIERSFEVPVSAVVLVPMDQALRLEGEDWTLAEGGEGQGMPSLSYTAGPVATGQKLVFRLVTQSQSMPVDPEAAAGARNSPQQIAIGLVALAAAVVGVYLLWRGPAPGALPAPARPLVENIAALDRDFELGKMDEAVYHRQRKSLKRKLRHLLEENAAG